MCAVWRLEYQQRCATHYHILMLGVPFIEQDWLKLTWKQVVEHDGPEQRSCGVRVQKVRNVDATINYLTKSSPRVPEGHQGRWWGVVGASNLYLAEQKIIEVTSKQMVQLRRSLDKAKLSRARQLPHPRHRAHAITRARRRRSDSYGFVYYGSIAGTIERLLTSLRM